MIVLDCFPGLFLPPASGEWANQAQLNIHLSFLLGSNGGGAYFFPIFSRLVWCLCVYSIALFHSSCAVSNSSLCRGLSQLIVSGSAWIRLETKRFVRILFPVGGGMN